MAKPAGREERDAERRREARRALERVDRDSETLGTSSLARTASRFATHFGAADEDDPIERLGKRIGRGLGLVAFVGLAVYLFLAYVIR